MHKGGSFVNRSVFGRSGRSCGVSSIRLAPQKVSGKLSTALNQIVSGFFQEFLVTGIIIIFPDVCCQPGTGHRIEVPRHIFAFEWSGKSENIGRNGCGPSSCSEISLCCFLSRFYQCTDKVHQRECTFIEVGRASRPVVHLYVDVVMVVYSPRTVYVVVPDALQVGRHVARS